MKLLFLAALSLTVTQVTAADTYNIDPVHSFITFSVPHLMISHVRGKFDKMSGAIVVNDGHIESASGVIQTESVDTGVAARDKDLRSAEFFDAEKYPTITFQTTHIEKDHNGITLVGNFTMHGVTKELTLHGKFSGPIKDPWGKSRVGLEARTRLNRKDFGMTYSKTLDSGGALIGDEIEIGINAEATKAEAP